MKKVMRYLFLIAVFLSFSSCNLKDDYDPTDINSYDRPLAVETMQKIITAFDNEDSETLEELFSEVAKQNYDIEKQIEEAMEYYKGKSVNPCEDVSYFFTNSSKISDNKYYYKSIQFMLLNMETDAGESYSFNVFYTLVDENDPSQIGLSKIYFIDPEDNVGYELAIGAKLKD